MGVQVIGPRNLRRVERQLGMEVLHAVCLSNWTWDVFVRYGDGHRHVRLDKRTGEWEWSDGCGFTTCHEGRWGQRVPLDAAHAASATSS